MNISTFETKHKLISLVVVFALIFSLFGASTAEKAEASVSPVLVDTDFSDWETISEKPLVAGSNASISYVWDGAAGDQSRNVTSADSDLYELSGNSSRFSWAEIEVSSDKLSVKVYKYGLSTDEAVLWNSYGIKKINF